MTTPNREQPAADELEITLLGRGRGESCVVHLGNGRWMVVDSFWEPQRKVVTQSGTPRSNTTLVPAAQRHLDWMGVPKEAVEAILITHFHQDHYQGLHALHDTYTNAKLFVTAALQNEKYKMLFSSDGLKDLEDIRGVLRRAQDRHIGGSTVPGGLILTSQGHNIIVDPTQDHLMVYALAPSPEAIAVSVEEIATLIDNDADSAQYRTQLRDDNRTSIALHIRACGHAALLCGDVINNPPQLGWTAIVENPDHHVLEQASLVKIPHHGSQEAHSDDMWDRMVHDRSPMLIAPYWPQIPKRRDQERLMDLGPLWQTGPADRHLTTEWAPTTAQDPITGVVQARRRGDDPWDIRTGHPAHQVT